MKKSLKDASLASLGLVAFFHEVSKSSWFLLIFMKYVGKISWFLLIFMKWANLHGRVAESRLRLFNCNSDFEVGKNS